MKYFKSNNNQVWAFEADGSQDAYIDSTLISITEAEADAIRFPTVLLEPPSVVSMRQARLALHQSGVLPRITNAIMNSSEADKITWEYATEVNRNDTLVKTLATGLGLSETDLDNLFTLAATL